ncbi:MAG: hypothetical protein II625_01900, partial [Bacilli bacterium]|nr:hypothetical protein [Bacilli bacterium]
ITAILTSVLTTIILFTFIKDYFIPDEYYITDLEEEINSKDNEINELENSKFSDIEDTLANMEGHLDDLEEQVSEIYEKIIPENERQQKTIHIIGD